MRTPILFGFTALCVLSSPSLVESFSHNTIKSVSRTIASNNEIQINDRSELFDSNSPEAFIEGIREDLKKISKRSEVTSAAIDLEKKEVFEIRKITLEKDINKVISGLDNLSKQVNKVREENEIEAIIELQGEITKSQESSNQIKDRINSLKVITKDVTACEFRNEIDQLTKDIKDLLKDNVKVVTEVSENEKDIKTNVETKEEKEPKDIGIIENSSRAQMIYSMGMLFGQGLQTSFQMQRPAYAPNPQFNYNPMLSYNNGPWMNMMQRNFSGLTTANQTNGQLGERSPFIPNFNRTAVEAESISFN